MADQEITRKILDRINNDPAISQKKLAEEIGISVGMVNWHVKRCVTKGMIKLKQAPVRRYLYYLTPDGFAEKIRLTSSYLQSGFNLFRTGRFQYENILQKCRDNGWHNVVIFGDTELTELVLLMTTCFKDIRIHGILDREASRAEYNGIAIMRSPRQLPEKNIIQAVIACHYLSASNELVDRDLILGELGLDRSRFLVPDLLK